tara:strand:- start:2208 stop:2951 length:744 start_codon:yes stop_codon:yes gene_type:complete
MKKLLLLLVVVLVFNNTMAQMTWMTAYKVEPLKMKDAKSAIEKKTKKYNSDVDGELIYTYEIIAGDRANYLVRSGFAQSMAQFDSYGTQGLDYWMENVAPLMNNVGGTEYFSHADDASFDDAEPGTNKIWKVLHYNVKRNSGPDFWKFRTRVAKAAEKVGNLSLHVWAGSLGGPSGHVMVGYGNPDMSGIDNESETWPKVIEAYNELFEESFEEDSKAFNESLTTWGNFSEVWRWLPGLSSPAVSVN